MSEQNDHNKKVTLLTGLDSYRKFHKETNQIIDSFDNDVLKISEMEKNIEKILKVIKMHKIPGEDLTEKSIYAVLYTIMANTKANRSHYIALRAYIEALNDFMNLSQCS